MQVAIVLLIIALLILLWQSVTDQAMRVLKERAGLVYDARGPRIARGATVTIIVLIVAFMASPRKWFEPPPPMIASYAADSLWMGMDSTLIGHIGGEREELVRYGRELIRRVRDKGLPVILISHNMPHVFEIADRIHVARLGKRGAVLNPKKVSMSDTVAVMTGAMPADQIPAEWRA